jgi:hypothetical protein
VNNAAMAGILASITPERIEQLIYDLVMTQAEGKRTGVALAPIIEALTEGHDLGTGMERWTAYDRLKKAVQHAVIDIAGMRYIESDA